MILHTIPAGMNQTNCYIVGCEETHMGAVIDPGGEGPRLVREISSTELAIQYVLITHAHFDHIGGVADVMEATKAELAIHPDEVPLLEAGGGASQWGLQIKPSPAPDVMLSDGQILKVGELRFEVLLTPGHSPGGVTFYEQNEGAAFVGDVLFSQGVGRTDLYGGDRETLMRSIKQVLFGLPADTVVYPGHGPKTTIERERRTNPWL